MKLAPNTKIRATDDAENEWEIITSLESTRHRHSYLARSCRPDLEDQIVKLTVCRYEERLLGNRNYVDNLRRRLMHEAEMLTVPLNVLPEPVDLFTCQNPVDRFRFDGAKGYSTQEPVLVTEAYAGDSLEGIIQAESGISEARALRIALQLCALLDDLHRRGVLAYELRPEDIIVDASDHDRVWLLGCANFQRFRTDGVLQPNELVVPLSDFSFAAPEVEAGKPLDVRADQYSLGAILLYMLTGRIARNERKQGEVPAAAFLKRFSEPTRQFVVRCLAREAVDRYGDSRAAKASLRTAFRRLGGDVWDGPEDVAVTERFVPKREAAFLEKEGAHDNVSPIKAAWRGVTRWFVELAAG